MQWLAEICVRRPVFAWVLMLLIIVAGAVGYTQLGLDHFPNVEPPFVVVTTVYDGASPEEVEADLSDEIEAAVNTIAGIKELRSTSSQGVSQVMIEFELDVDPDVASQDVRDKLALIRHTLPDGIEEPIISKVDFNAAPVLDLALRGDLPIRELTRIADQIVRRRIESIDGVGQVHLVGDRERRVYVWLDPIRLRAAGLTALDVHSALATQNTNMPGGALETGPEQISVRVAGRVTDAAQIGRLVVREGEGGAIRVEDVARVEDGQAEEESAALLDGTPAVGLAIRKQSGRNSVEVVDGVRARLAAIEAELPPGVTLAEIRDGSASARTSVHAVEEHLVLGAIFASLVVLLMLGSTRSTFISALSIPISIVGTFAMMWAFGLSLNLLTLLALALGVGIVIDDAIVVLENIVTFVETKRQKPFPAAIHATDEIGLAVLATTLSLMAVFVPVAFMPGIVGRFLASFGITMAVAVFVSMLVSFTITPMLAARMLPPPGSPRGRVDAALDRVVSFAYRPIERAYVVTLAFVMRHRWLVVVVCVASLAAIPAIASRLPAGFLPEDDLGHFQVVVRTPEGTSLAETRLVAQRVAADVGALPEVEHAYLTIGAGPQGAPNLANVYVRLSAPETRGVTQAELMQMARERVGTDRSSAIRVSVAEIPIVPTGASSARVQYAISGPDIDVLTHTAEDVMAALRESGRAVDVDQSLIVGRPSLDVTVDRDRAADLGVRTSDLAMTMRLFIGGVSSTSFADGDDDIEVYVQAERRYRRDENALGLLDVPSRTRAPVPLRSVVSASHSRGISQIERLGRQRQITVNANPAPGVGDEEVAAIILGAYERAGLSDQYRVRPVGLSAESAKLGAGFALVIGMAFILMYLILAAQFESWIHPLTILVSLPLTVPFALLSLMIFEQSLNLFTGLGLLVLFGVVKKNSILQVDHTNQLRARGMPRLQAILEANRDRLRPILMTTLAFVAGMIPLLTSRGIGSGNNRATAAIVLGGQSLSLVLTLLATPVVYSLLDDIAIFARKLFARGPALDRGQSEVYGPTHEAPRPPPVAREPLPDAAE